MLLLLIYIIGLLIINFGVGLIIKNVLKTENQSFVLTSFLGILSITLLQNIIAFFSPANSFVEFVFLIFGSIGFLLFLKKKDLSYLDFRKNINFWFYLLFTMIVFVGSFSPYLYDHFSYYVPTISYLKEFGLVKGISNLDLLLGQTSFWHIYQAIFSHFIDVFFKINTYLLVLFLIYIYERKQYFLLIFIPIFLVFVQQPSPDLPILIITLIVINELMNKREKPILLYLSMFAFCIKPIIFWLPILVILHGFSQKKFSVKWMIPVLGLGILLMIKNIWLFGFPIFPISFPDFDLAWKPSQEMLTYSSQIGLLKSYDMKYSYQQVSEFNFFEKIYYWFLIGYKSILNVGILISLLIITIFTFKKKERFYYLLLICLIVKSILIFSFSAQYRFFIDVYLVAIFLLVKNISVQKAIFTSVFLSFLISTIFTFPGFVQRFDVGKKMTSFSWPQLYQPKENKSVNINTEYKIGNLNFYVPKFPFQKDFFPSLNIYDLKLYDYYGVFPQYIGKDFKQGFYQRKLNQQEKNQLKKIISETEKYNPKVP